MNRSIEEEEKRDIYYSEEKKMRSFGESLDQQQSTTFSGSVSANNFGESFDRQQEAIWSNSTSVPPLPSYPVPRGSIACELAAAALRLEEKETKYSTPCTSKVAPYSGTGGRNSGLSQPLVSKFLFALKETVNTMPHLFTTGMEEALGRQTDGGLFVSPAPTLVFMKQSGVFSQAPTTDNLTDALLEANLILPSSDPHRKLPQLRVNKKRVRGWMFVRGWKNHLWTADSKCHQSGDNDSKCHQSGDIGCSEASIVELTPEQQAKLWQVIAAILRKSPRKDGKKLGITIGEVLESLKLPYKVVASYLAARGWEEYEIPMSKLHVWWAPEKVLEAMGFREID